MRENIDSVLEDTNDSVNSIQIETFFITIFLRPVEGWTNIVRTSKK
jgi:hypothetical protein